MIVKKILKAIIYVVYYGFASRLPITHSPIQIGQGWLRSLIFKMSGAKVGFKVNIEPGVRVAAPWSMIEIGDNSGVGINARLGAVSIGKNVMMAPECNLLTDNHSFLSREKPMCLQGFSGHKKIVIEDDVWIGQRVTIMGGVILGAGSIIAAGSVVTKNVKPYCIYGGNPAVFIKERP